MTITFKTRDQLKAEGFKNDYPYWYTGTKKEPGAAIHYNHVEQLAGKKVRVVSVKNNDTGEILITRKGREYQVRTYALVGGVDFEKLTAPQSIVIRGKRATFDSFSFVFSCSHAELKPAQARKLAAWVLKCLK